MEQMARATTAVVTLTLLLLQSSLLEAEAPETSQDCSGGLKQLNDLVYQQGTALAELKVKVSYMEKENAGELLLPYLVPQDCGSLPRSVLAGGP